MTMTTDPGLSPATELERFYQDILQTQMAGLPVLNPALQVETVGFTRWENGWLGVVITPWFMGLLWVPTDREVSLGTEGAAVTRSLPLMAIDFNVCRADGIGDYLCCSLYSPMGTFADQDGARATATTVLAAVLEPAVAAGPVVSQPVTGYMLSFDRQVTRRRWLKLFTGVD
jgi:[NiFe] hydrogenase assembly HybE family chaperone